MSTGVHMGQMSKHCWAGEKQMSVHGRAQNFTLPRQNLYRCRGWNWHVCIHSIADTSININTHLQASSLNGHKCDYIRCSFQQQSTPRISIYECNIIGEVRTFFGTKSNCKNKRLVSKRFPKYVLHPASVAMLGWLGYINKKSSLQIFKVLLYNKMRTNKLIANDSTNNYNRI